ncbi:MAG: serine acetyltransferase [Deltaproteobacteria bacterium]|nr:serine acetyltransferase [Deltaproteobacteria bacterium]
METKLSLQDQLEEVVDLVMASYDGSHPIDSLESAALPNRRAVIEALQHLHSAIYLGFYSTRPLDRSNLHYSISEHLYPAYAILVEQIRRAISFEAVCCRAAPDRDPKWAEEVVLRLFRKLPELRHLLNLDVVAAFDGDPAAKSVEEIVFSYPAIHAITTHRIAHELYLEPVPMIPRIMSEEAHSRTGIDLNPGARIGERFFIDHGTGVVIGETTMIGNNVKIYQGVTLGALSLPRGADLNSLRHRKRHPTIEDDVTIYSGATILGGDTVIGKGSVIGGNVWLVESVPPGSKISYNAALTRR